MKKYLMMIFISLLFVSAVYAAHPEYNEKQVCADCHKDCSIDKLVMTNKTKEKKFVDDAFRQFDGEFGQKHCYNSCHISKCEDCHKGKGKNISKPKNDDCFVCHKDTYTGIEYAGLGIREDHERYKRGIEKDGEYYLKMLPLMPFYIPLPSYPSLYNNTFLRCLYHHLKNICLQYFSVSALCFLLYYGYILKWHYLPSRQPYCPYSSHKFPEMV